MSFKLTLTMPKVQENWWKPSKNELEEIVQKKNKESWAAEQDPVTNAKWAPRKPPTGSWPILNKTGKMQGSTRIKAAGGIMQFVARTGVNYGKYHQYGTSKMVRRRWLGIGRGMSDEMASVIAKNIFKGKIRLTITA